MKIFTNRQLFELVRAVSFLERNGKKFLIDFGYENAMTKARELKEELLKSSKVINLFK